MGAWIEIVCYFSGRNDHQSLPTWERGLKCSQFPPPTYQNVSLPTWERGLKSIEMIPYPVQKVSLPTWERGLKSIVVFVDKPVSGVAPHVGAWIEIQSNVANESYMTVAPHVGAWIEISWENVLCVVV